MDGLFHHILNMSLTGSFVILAVLLVRLFLKRFPKWISYALWTIVLFRLLCPISFESAVAILPSAQVVPETIMYAQEPAIDSGISIVDEALNPVIRSSLTPAIGASVNPVQILFWLWSRIWAVGVIAALLYAVISAARLYSRIRFAALVSDNVYESERIDTAFVFGILRPRIYLPAGLDEERREHILLHERAHIRRLDHVVRLISYLVLSMHWFNPLVWIAYVFSGRDMEFSCDESVMKQAGSDIRKAYGETLLQVSARRSGIMIPPAFGETNAKGRIRNVLHYKKPAFWAVLLAAAAAIVAGACLLANPVTAETAEGSPVAEGVTEERPFYSIMHIGASGEVLSYRPSLLADGTKLAEDIIMDYLVKSYAQPGEDIAGLGDCYMIRQEFEKESHDYYAYLLDGRAVLQGGADGFCSPISDDLYQRLEAYMGLPPDGGSTDPTSAETVRTLAETQARRLAEHLAEFSEYPRGEDGFGREFTGDWNGDGKQDKAYVRAGEQIVTVEFGDGTAIAADALILEKMSEWGRSFLIEAADLTGDGQNEILLFIDLGGNGGHGQYALYPYKRDANGWALMDAPYHGYELALTWRDHTATVSSGNYSEIVGDEAMIRAHYFAEDEDNAQAVWDELTGAAHYWGNAADAPCDIALVREDGRTLVKISQYVTGMTGAHVDKLGYLVTTLEWDESGAYAIKDMRFVLYPQ